MASHWRDKGQATRYQQGLGVQGSEDGLRSTSLLPTFAKPNYFCKAILTDGELYVMTACDAGNAVMMTIHVVICCPCGTQNRPKSSIPTAFVKAKADSYRIFGFGRFVLAVMLNAEGGLQIQQCVNVTPRYILVEGANPRHRIDVAAFEDNHLGHGLTFPHAIKFLVWSGEIVVRLSAELLHYSRYSASQHMLQSI